jgi:hypothetical protein
MQRGALHTVLAAVAAVLVIGFIAWSALRTPDECYACKRPIHEHSRTVAMVNGHARQFCCPACAYPSTSRPASP